MTKQDLIKRVCKRGNYIPDEIATVINITFEEIKAIIKEGEKLSLRGFGTFYPHHAPDKVARNLSTNTAVNVPAHIVPKLKPCKSWKTDINKKQ